MSREFLNYILSFCRIVEWGYAAVIILFLLWLLVKKWRNEMLNLLVAMNVLLLISSFIGLLGIIINGVWKWYSHSDYEWFAFRYNGLFAFSAYYAIMIVNTASVLLLLFPLFRRSWPYAFYLLLLSHLEQVQVWLAKIFRDYMPSSWQVINDSYWSDRIIASLIFAVAVAIIYAILAATNALPFTSSFNFIRRTKNVQ